ncbi:NRDE family protein [Hugenholtzia roseola]|uniref:NRDE family protein n=1 Tax=Hugenholtzia roseola TaxID=1002 RepID=UPI00041D1FF4|nr:NRDE family protein [Hugenholtzia roseola]
MCTLTYLPLEGQNFILTSNRDELRTRPIALPPALRKVENKELLFAQDPQAAGTWLGLNRQGDCICLLNGAFERHTRRPPYRKSRGLLVLEALVWANTEAFLAQDFEGIEPFTLVWIESDKKQNKNAQSPEYQHLTKTKLNLHEIRWDGETLHQTQKDPDKPHIWSSATLYSPSVQNERETFFAQHFSQKELSEISDKVAEKIIKFHLLGQNLEKVEYEAEFCCEKKQFPPIFMNRKEGQTVSTTQIHAFLRPALDAPQRYQILYRDWLQAQNQTQMTWEVSNSNF